MDQKKIERINALSHKSRTAEGLTPAEKAEQQALRQEYLEGVRRNMRAQLKNTVIQEPDGTRHHLAPKKQAPKAKS